MRRSARYIYVGLAWLTLVGVLIPFFLAGMSLFVSRTYWSVHIDFGWGSELPLGALIIAGLLAWIPRRLTLWLVAMIAIHFIHTLLPGSRDWLPVLAALHPVTALLLAWITFVHARKSGQMLLESSGEAEASEALGSTEPGIPA